MGLFVTPKNASTEIRYNPAFFVKDRLKKVEISGRSRMTDPGMFYEDLQKTLEFYFYKFRKTLIIDFKFDYLSSGSSKWLFHILRSMQNLAEKEGLLEINWYYEGDDDLILEAGEVLKSLLKIPFHIKEF
jgi:hypothetical protein